MTYDPDDGCQGDCNYIVRRETRTLSDGTQIVEDIDVCTGCSRVFGRTVIPPPKAE